nr:MAG TPA: hypothetical protein [Caudoviricetes sp.]
MIKIFMKLSYRKISTANVSILRTFCGCCLFLSWCTM